ncbi:HEAT repeat domain-containing protein [Natrialbaceae archaeon GCM10025810]|uniref:HEAT repeat domain-containing protein n=1 Tax=Halovalidus salilacus TaxID=3075124 RepID=UPI0036061E78
MDRNGGETVERRDFDSSNLDLPSMLARLDDGDLETLRSAVTAIRSAVDDDPEPYLPTVPKLRSLLEAGPLALDADDPPRGDGADDVDESGDSEANDVTETDDDEAPAVTETDDETDADLTASDDAGGAGEAAETDESDDGTEGITRAAIEDLQLDIAYCLAKLAVESPDDVAPSAEVIVSVVADAPDHPARTDLLRCLAAVAAERPDAVVDRVDEVVALLESLDGHDRWGIALLARLSAEYPTAIEPAIPLLAGAVEEDAEAAGVPALRALGRLVRADVAKPHAVVPVAADALEDDRSFENTTLHATALGCLSDAAETAPAVVRPRCPTIVAALDGEDPNARATAAVTLARVAAGVDDPAAAIEPGRSRLLELLEDDRAVVRANACVALGYGEVDDAVGRLEDLSRVDPDPNVRERAAWAVDRLR